MKYLILDVEVYPNQVMVGILNAATNNITVLDGIDQIKAKLKPHYRSQNITFITFNGMRYDLPLIEHILYDSDIQPYRFSQYLIEGSDITPSWHEQHVDLLNILPRTQRCSLKELGHRLGYNVLENLPFKYDQRLTDAQWQKVIAYNEHDLNITKLLWGDLKDEYKTRKQLQQWHKFNMFFAGAPRIAERIILAQIEGKIVNEDMLHRTKLPLSSKVTTFWDKMYDILEETY